VASGRLLKGTTGFRVQGSVPALQAGCVRPEQRAVQNMSLAKRSDFREVSLNPEP